LNLLDVHVRKLPEQQQQQGLIDQHIFNRKHRLIQINCSVVNQLDQFSTEPRSDGIPWRTAARASRLPGFPPKLPTRAFHSSEESIYGAADFQQQPLKENPISRIQRLENKLREERQAKKQLEEQLQQILAKNDLAQRQQDQFCAVVENTFQKFQQFLDFLRSKRLGELITMAGLDDAFINPLDELRETSLNVANGSNTNHPLVTTEKSEERSSSSSSSETNTKNDL